MKTAKKMPKKSPKKSTKQSGRSVLKGLQNNPKKQAPQGFLGRTYAKWKALRIWKKTVLILLALLIAFTSQAYALAYWYQQKHKNEPLAIGVTYIDGYARYLDLDPHQTFLALRDDLGFKRYRLVSYWDQIEKTPGVYDFSELDWQFDRVGEVNGEVTLAIGLRQPRWPECHAPDWVAGQTPEQWYPQLAKFMQATIAHYKNRPELHSYQLENEFFLGVFGDCAKFTAERSRLQSEFDLVKAADPNHPVILSYANNYFGVTTSKPIPDQIGVSVYKRVWDKTVTKGYFEYPFPSWYYSWRAAQQEILTGKSSMLHELQAEPWPPMGIKDASIAEQDKSMDAARLGERIDYGVDTGFKDVDLWGGEWWYWRKVKFHDDSLWNTVKAKMAEYGQTSAK